MSVSYGGDSVTFADSSTISSGWTGFKNRIINGAMVIDQRNAGAATNAIGSSGFIIDRWQYFTNATSGAFNAGQNLNSVTPPVGFSKYIGLQVASVQSPTGTNAYFLGHKIEGLNVADLGWGAVGAQTITLSFWVRSSVTGTHSGNIQNASNARSYVFSYSINSANTWTYISVAVPGDTTGTWANDNTQSITIYFNLGCGTGLQTASGSWNAGQYLGVSGGASVVSNASATFYITGVQLEKGSTASSFEYRPYGTEFALCQRYYEKGLFGFVGTITSGHAGGTAVPFAVTKRAAPTMSQSASLNASGFATGVGSYFVTGVDGVAVYHTATVTGNCSWVDRYIADAEL